MLKMEEERLNKEKQLFEQEMKLLKEKKELNHKKAQKELLEKELELEH